MNEIVVAVVYDFVSLLFLSRDLPRLWNLNIDYDPVHTTKVNTELRNAIG
jgi:hypothetical protein